MQKIVGFALSLYVISLLCSIAGMEFFGWLTGLLGLIYYLKMRNQGVQIYFPSIKVFGGLWAFFAVVVIGAFFSSAQNYSPWQIIGDARWVILCTLLVLAVQVISQKSQEKFFVGLMVFATAVGIYSFVQHFFGYDLLRSPKSYIEHMSIDPVTKAPFWRTRGFFSHPLTYANSMGIFACFPLAYLLNTPYKQFQRNWLMALICLLCVGASIATTYARGGWLAFGAAAIVLVLMRLPIKKSLGLLAVAIALIAAIGSQSVVLKKRLFSIINFSNGSQSDRFNLWQANWEMFKDHPFWGVGYNLNRSFAEAYLEELGHYNHFIGHAHNIYLQILAGTGLFGFLAFSAFMVTIFYIIARHYKGSQGWIKTVLLAAIGAQVAMLVGGLTEANFVDGEVNHMVIFVWAWVISGSLNTNTYGWLSSPN